MYRLFSLSLIIFGLIPEYSLIEVNSGNCQSNSVINTQCKFSIKIKPPLETDLMCQLKFTNMNVTTAVLVNNSTILSQKIGTNCPSFRLILNNGTNNKIGANCSNSLQFSNQTYPGFIFGKIEYTNYGVKDVSTDINMEIYLLGLRDCIEVVPAPSSSSNIIWILIIVCAMILIVIIVVIIAIDCMRKQPQKKAANQQQQAAAAEVADSKHEPKHETKDRIPESRPMINETSA